MVLSMISSVKSLSVSVFLRMTFLSLHFLCIFKSRDVKFFNSGHLSFVDREHFTQLTIKFLKNSLLKSNCVRKKRKMNCIFLQIYDTIYECSSIVSDLFSATSRTRAVKQCNKYSVSLCNFFQSFSKLICQSMNQLTSVAPLSLALELGPENVGRQPFLFAYRLRIGTKREEIGL